MVRWSSFVFFLCTSCLCGELIEVDSLESAMSYFTELDGDALAVFDLDHTLICPRDALFQINNQVVRDEIFYECAGKKWGDLDDFTRSLWLEQRKIQLVNPNSCSLIESLQSRGVKVVALTLSRAGPVGYIENFEHLRVSELQKLGFDLSSSFGKIHLIAFLEWSENGMHPLYYEGILFTSHRKKGELLGAFLDRVDYHPTKVVMLDDALLQLQRVAKEMEEREIPFIGIHYQEATHLSKIVDVPFARFQVEKLVKEGKWVGDEENVKPLYMSGSGTSERR